MCCKGRWCVLCCVVLCCMVYVVLFCVVYGGVMLYGVLHVVFYVVFGCMECCIVYVVLYVVLFCVVYCMQCCVWCCVVMVQHVSSAHNAPFQYKLTRRDLIFSLGYTVFVGYLYITLLLISRCRGIIDLTILEYNDSFYVFFTWCCDLELYLLLVTCIASC